MKLPATKIFNNVTSTGELRGIALDCFEILCNSPGLTAGEVYLRYKNKYPDTERSRNEIAKRVSDLLTYGVIRVSGKTVCPTSGRLANTWEPTGNKPQKNTDNVVSLVNHVENTEAVVSTTSFSSNVPTEISARTKSIVVLNDLASRSRLLLRFRWLMTKNFAQKTEETLRALEFALKALK